MPNRIPLHSIPDSLARAAEVVNTDRNSVITPADFGSKTQFECFRDLMERTVAYDRGPQFLEPKNYAGVKVVIDPAFKSSKALSGWAQELSGRKTTTELRKRNEQVVVVRRGSEMHLKAIARIAKGEKIHIVSNEHVSEAIKAARAKYLDRATLAGMATSYVLEVVAPSKGWETPEVHNTYDATEDWALSLKFGLYYDSPGRNEEDLVKIDVAVSYGDEYDTEVGVAMDRRTGKVIEFYA